MKKNLINVSYHIAQYTNIISDLRCEIQRLKKKIAEQASRQVSSDRADIRNIQGKFCCFYFKRVKDTSQNLLTAVFFSFFFFCGSFLFFYSLAAEVQAHSSQQSRAEMDDLREQLLDAFRQQMRIRKSLIELENSNMEIQIDTSKHLVTIAESVGFLLPLFTAKHTYQCNDMDCHFLAANFPFIFIILRHQGLN